ncbi:MAG: carboxypeptidase-like regulatory domain-containing protein [Acidobacteria bacterium]|nr:carboxypeptidase-like regulatory domain-containing protein [Acidobacteriota bacterium]
MRIGRVLQISLIAALTLMLSGCGRDYHIKGRVVFLQQLQNSAGYISELTGKDFPQDGNPIAGAKVRMLHDLDKDDRPVAGSVWEHNTVTDENGYFDTSDYATPSKASRVGLEVSKDGYKTVYTTYIDYSDVEPQVFLVVLVPTMQSDNASNPAPR